MDIVSGVGRRDARLSSRVSAAFCSGDRPACAEWRVGALRYAVAKALYDSSVFGIDAMRLKLGKSSAVVVFGVEPAGREDNVIKTFVKGCEDCKRFASGYSLER